jgi:hypothetical protein
VSRTAFLHSTSSIKQKACMQCLRLRGKTAFLLAVLTLHLSRTHNDMLLMSLPAEHFNFLVRCYYQTHASHWAKQHVLLSTVHDRRQLITPFQCPCTDRTTACLRVSDRLTECIECSQHCPALSLDRLDVSIQLADCNSSCCSTNSIDQISASRNSYSLL